MVERVYLLTDEEANLISEGLSHLPMRTSLPLVQKMQNQFQASVTNEKTGDRKVKNPQPVKGKKS